MLERGRGGPLAREQAALRAARRDGGGANPARANPPAYYLYALSPYLLARAGGTVLDRLYLMRLWSVPLAGARRGAAWLLAGELLGRDRGAQLRRGAVCGPVRRWRRSSPRR